MNLKVIVVGCVIITAFLIISWLGLPRFGFEIEFLASPTGFFLILLTGALIALSGFLPYNWGKILREVAYFCLFVLLILVEINLMKPFISVTKVDLNKCQVGTVFPSAQQLETGTFVYNALQFTSCVLTGYFPATMGDIGWTSFYIFYLILPFAFAWTFTYGLMRGMGIEGWFGAFGETAIRIISFILAMYAARVLFGAFLLDFLGYGVWGLAAVFGAAVLTKGLQKIMEGWYEIEQMAVVTRGAIKGELKIAKKFGETVKPILDAARREATTDLNVGKTTLGHIRNIPLYAMLDAPRKNIVDWYLDQAMAAGTPEEFNKHVSDLEKYLKKLI
jgi:hypothetical protein